MDDIKYMRNLIEKYKLNAEFIVKDIFPYTYINTFDHYKHKSFPDISYFNTDKTTYEKYRSFYYANFKDLGSYSDYYHMKDVLLLSDIMEKNRSMIMEKYATEVFSHYTINSLTWEIFKKYNPIEIKIIDNYSMYSCFKNMIRGGTCGIGSNRYAISNNMYMKHYDENQPSSYIMHFDINGMYAHVMRTFKLPYDDFSYLSDQEVRDFNIWDYDEKSSYGYILCIDISEIDILYHDYYLDLPLFPQKRKIY